MFPGCKTACPVFISFTEINAYFLGTGENMESGTTEGNMEIYWKIKNVIKILPKYFILCRYFCFLTLFTAKGSTLQRLNGEIGMLPRWWINKPFYGTNVLGCRSYLSRQIYIDCKNKWLKFSHWIYLIQSWTRLYCWYIPNPPNL